VLQGQVYLPAELLRATPVVEQASSQVSEAQLRQMTKRQLRVLQCLAQGLSNKQIADLLCIAETTVKTHVSDVLRKMQVRNRTQAALVVDAKVLDTVLGG
jgi:DNA-binding NarL/FixJ family response regulator